MNRLKSDRHRVLEACAASRETLTTTMIAAALGLAPERVARTVAGLVGDHALTFGRKLPSGEHAWIMDAIGRAELARLDSALTGQPLKRQHTEDDGWEMA